MASKHTLLTYWSILFYLMDLLCLMQYTRVFGNDQDQDEVVISSGERGLTRKLYNMICLIIRIVLETIKLVSQIIISINLNQ